MMQAAQAKADEIGKPVSLAIVNAGGALVALDRFKEPPGFTLQVAEGKAVASAVMGFDSAVVAGWGGRPSPRRRSTPAGAAKAAASSSPRPPTQRRRPRARSSV